MFENNRVDFKDSNIGRDFVGRDQHNQYNQQINNTPISPFRSLLIKIRDDNNPKDNEEFSNELYEFMQSYKGDIIGLAQKLKDGNREYYIEYAEEQKERYAKIILKSANLPFEQELHLRLLASVRSKFQPIYAKIKQGRSFDEIDAAHQKLISEIETDLEDDPLKITRQGIDGIIYYLTGNCFIKWS